MSDISKLIQEAKPLYFKRKRRRLKLKIAAGMAGCLTIAFLLTGMPSRVNPSSTNIEEFYTYLYDDTSYQVLIGANATNNTDEWLTDVYGLTQVI